MKVAQYLRRGSSYSTTYAFSSLGYFFSVSEVIDFQMGTSGRLSLQGILSNLQQSNPTLHNVLGLFSYLFKQGSQQIPEGSKQFKVLYIDNEHIREVLQNDGVKIVYSLLGLLIKGFEVSDQVTIDDQMMLKSLVNTFYVLIFWIQKDNLQQALKENNQLNFVQGSPYLNRFYKDVDIDTFLIRLLTLSLEVHYIPIKKISIIYTKVLANIFSFQSTNAKNQIFIHPVTIYNDPAIHHLPTSNTIQENYLEKLKEKSPPLTEIPRNKTVQPIQQFYRKNNIGDCPLAQAIVVGLLRSLLTICNSQNHKKFTTVKGAGVDSFREWQISYRFAMQNWATSEKSCSASVLQKIKDYQQFDRITNEKTDPNKISLIFHEFYMHKIYTTSIITNFFMVILLGLKMNVPIQFSYFLQLISDANGILVFLKFLTDKFQFLEDVNDSQVQFREGNENDRKNVTVQFKDKVMLTVYSILNMLHTSCNNYPEKVKNYLFEYNSYLIIKKIPVLFFPAFKNSNNKQPIEPKKKDELQGSLPNLPSKEQLQELINFKPQNEKQAEKCSQEAPLIMRRLTETCYDLLKVQIPYFSKKMKDSNNMKMLIDIYCRFPKEVEPIKRTALQKIQLKCQNKKHLANIQQHGSKAISSVEQLKNVHNEYNNLYYWSNDFVNQLEGGKVVEKEEKKEKGQRSAIKSMREQEESGEVDKDFDFEGWLEENIWRYYD